MLNSWLNLDLIKSGTHQNMSPDLLKILVERFSTNIGKFITFPSWT